jgi:farnesyl-diphosphate farnesyltransferase
MTSPAAVLRLDPDTLRFAEEILPRVSRTFALTIPVLREPLRTTVGLSYLLCRIVDTVEDHPDFDREARDRRFDRLLAALEGDEGVWEGFLADWPAHSESHYDALVRRAPELFAGLAELPPVTRTAVEACLREMILGMASFPAAAEPPVEACPDLDCLDRYCHAVAGTVGVLLTRLFAGRLGEEWASPQCVERGRRFGLGLQFVNVLKDHRDDRARGIVFLPRRDLEDGRPGAPPTPEGLERITRHALAHLAEGHRYILGIPAEHADLRLFCLWAHHLALATLRVRAHGIRPPKVSREEVAVITGAAREAVGDDAALDALYDAYRDDVLTCFGG